MRRLFLILVLVSPLLVTAKPASMFSWMIPATSIPIEQVVSADGSYYCASTITDSKYEESAMSQEIFFTITAGEPLIRVPATPGGFRVE